MLLLNFFNFLQFTKNWLFLKGMWKPEHSLSQVFMSYLEDVLALNEVTVEVAGGMQLKEQLRNSTPFGQFVPLGQKGLSEL